MDRKQAYQQELRARLDQWQATIDGLETRSDEIREDGRIQLHRADDQLRAHHTFAQHRLDNLQQAGDDAWDGLKSGIDVTRKKLGNAIDSAVSRFQ